MTPKRIQRRRTKGWRKPPNTVCVSRPSRWSNGYRVAQDADEPDATWIVVSDTDTIVSHSFTDKVDATKDAISWFRDSLEIMLRTSPNFLEPLRGKNLACWCKLSDPCHADVLLELANKEVKK